MEKLKRLLSEADRDQIQIVVTESIFSMDGNAAPLKQLSLLKSQYSFVLLLDEAHSSGVYGAGGSGLANELGIESPGDITIVTLSKAFGCAGAVVCGSQIFCDALINAARAYVYSTAVSPIVPAAMIAGLRIMQQDPALQGLLKSASRRLREGLKKLQRESVHGDSPIVPVIFGSESAALNAASELREDGHYCIAIRPPTVAPKSSRLRITLSALHTDDEIDRLLDSLKRLAL